MYYCQYLEAPYYKAINEKGPIYTKVYTGSVGSEGIEPSLPINITTTYRGW
jgi:hypothetical protein